MISFPNCKINLGLNIVGKREDSYHDLQTIFLPIPFKDALEILPSENTELTITGLPLNSSNNLCIDAYRLLKQNFPHLPEVKMHLHKAIPMGAGLGGGSADAAFTLQLLNKKFELNLATEKLIQYALQLGSDCPFFIINKPCFAIGRGEILQPIDIDLSGYKLVLVNPNVHIETKWAFSQITPQEPKESLVEIISTPIENWRKRLHNDFESPVFAAYPEIKKIKEELYEQGAVYASMTGTGSTVYGIFSNTSSTDNNDWNNYFYKIIEL